MRPPTTNRCPLQDLATHGRVSMSTKRLAQLIGKVRGGPRPQQPKCCRSALMWRASASVPGCTVLLHGEDGLKSPTWPAQLCTPLFASNRPARWPASSPPSHDDLGYSPCSPFALPGLPAVFHAQPAWQRGRHAGVLLVGTGPAAGAEARAGRGDMCAPRGLCLLKGLGTLLRVL